MMTKYLSMHDIRTKIKNNPKKIIELPEYLRTSENYLELCKINSKIIRYMPKDYINGDIIDYIAENVPDCLVYISPKKITETVCKKVLKYKNGHYTDFSYFNVIPPIKRSKEMWKDYFLINPNKLTKENIIDFKFTSIELIDLYKKGIITLTDFPESTRDSDYWLEFAKMLPGLVYLIPKKFYNETIAEVVFSYTPLNTKYIPKEYITDEMSLEILNYVSKENTSDIAPIIVKLKDNYKTPEICQKLFNENPEIYFKEIPYNMRTKEMSEYIAQNSEENIIYIPKEYITAEIISQVKEKMILPGVTLSSPVYREVAKKYPRKFTYLCDIDKEILLTEEILDNYQKYDFIELISKKYKVDASIINNIILNFKETTPKLYKNIQKAIKNAPMKMAQNILTLDEIINELEVTKKALNKEQKIAFTYLYFTSSIDEDLENIFNAINKMKLTKEVKNVKLFLMNKLGYGKRLNNYEDPVNSIEIFENSKNVSKTWFEAYDHEKKFAFKHGKPTIKLKYMTENGIFELTSKKALEVIEKLTKEEIPLRNCIVNEAFLYETNCNLDEFIKLLTNKTYSLNEKIKKY